MSPSSPSLNSGHSPTRVRSMSAGESVLSPTTFDGLPERDSEEFQSYLFGSPARQPPKYSFPKEERLSTPKTTDPTTTIHQQHQQQQSHQQQHHTDAYTSFGDGAGTTATVNVYGNLIQLSRYLGGVQSHDIDGGLVGRSGFLSVDLPTTPGPAQIEERAHELADLATNPSATLCGLYMEDGSDVMRALDGRKPRIDFVRDRWPRFTFFEDDDDRGDEGKGYDSPFTLSVQYYVRDGTVYQQHVFEKKPGKRVDEHALVVPNVMIDTDVLIRQLDFATAEESRSGDGTAADGPGRERGYGAAELYSTFLGPHGYSLVLQHDSAPSSSPSSPSSTSFPPGVERLDGDGNERPSDTASMVLALFIDGVPHRIEEVENKWYKIANRNEAEAGFIRSGRVEITLAYRLQIASKAAHNSAVWRSSLIPASALRTLHDHFRTTPFTHLSLSPCPHENFALRRNLEHVLSVCSVPVSDEHKVCPAVALTCGDFSGHRIVTAASFYAFVFLLSVYEHLQATLSQYDGTPDSQEYVVEVMQRIRVTCKGHLKWVFEKAERGETGCFETHYWATGKSISGSTTASVSSKLGAKLLTDTPFQVIKAAEFTKTFRDNSFRDNVRECVGPWIKSLEALDRRKCFAFARPTSAFTGEYRLDDHVWIWKALRSIEDLGFGSLLKPQTVRARRKKTTRRSVGRRPDRAEDNEEGPRPPRDFSSAEAQRQIIRRFTTDNPVFMNQRMLAVSRSAGESRFLFFSRDTALFHDMNSAFFEVAAADSSRGQNRIAAWDRTIEVQRYHEENQDAGWDNPLRYALAIIMGKKGHAINQRSAEDMCNVATTVLLRSSSPSGLFAGQLDEVTKEPDMVQEKRTWDFYWHAAFEIPYALLKYGKNQKQEFSLLEPRTVITPHIEPFVFDTRSETEDVIGLNTAAIHGGRRHGLVMKKTVPFNDLFDHRSIIEPADEWLYNYPAFLEFDSQLERFQPFEINQNFNLYDLLRSISPDSDLWDEIRVDDRFRYNVGRWLCELGSETWEVVRNCYERDGKFFAEEGTRGTVLEVAKCGFMHHAQSEQHRQNHHHHDVGSPGRNIRMHSTSQFKEALSKIRTAHSAKKRLVWLPRVDDGSTILCCLAAPSGEKPKLSSFFDRHAKAEKYLLDDVASVLNMWETEFHLSYYQLVDKAPGQVEAGEKMSPLEVDGFPGRDKMIDRAAAGFRFDGDFFDRYWTCHFLERRPADDSLGEKDLGTRLQDIIFDKRLPKADRDKPLWRQRKVLELLLFDKIVDDMTQSANEVLEAAKAKVQQDLGVRTSTNAAVLKARSDMLSDALTDSISLFRIDSDAYLSFREEWAMLERILQVLEEDLSENLEKIHSWQSREEDRGPEKPRWTRNDERKYRSAVTKLEVSNGRRVQELERCRARIRSFGQSLTDRLDRVRDDLNLRGAEDIRLFTYITAFFLPLGFAVSIFSMSGSPEWLPIVGTIGVAFVTLFIVIVALINARTLELGFKAMLNFFRHSIAAAESPPRKASIASMQARKPGGLRIVAPPGSQAQRDSASTAGEEKADKDSPGILSFLTHRPSIRRAKPLRSPQHLV
ncbi:Mg2+ transporter zinc transport protein [Lasiodiplodia theobromae]|uniref:Mg2+ transporter zinc transport protein n=1 Tax=Lasiodiplodia theobromae TaxID=45133 RepID=UPI0015C315E2|nr:Mg2+ transporter zinc transport protein [Lasiodiplodia theobromae]KAF4533884.1 Mg2+ transporter zinc transport protein [Lasiodiplodia theobromae]